VSTLPSARARELFAAARVARLATIDAEGRPHLVPIVFVVVGDTVYSAVDHKPKRTTALRRLVNVAVDRMDRRRLVGTLGTLGSVGTLCGRDVGWIWPISRLQWVPTG
jgi:nitroimidazol reductase NimA-like FMN-containing flavoprotein (pyridoxamine 5'-phosphate oxidase superfamily)